MKILIQSIRATWLNLTRNYRYRKTAKEAKRVAAEVKVYMDAASELKQGIGPVAYQDFQRDGVLPGSFEKEYNDKVFKSRCETKFTKAERDIIGKYLAFKSAEYGKQPY